MKTVKLDDGKYTIVYDTTNSYPVKCLRYGEEWRDLLGDNLIFWLCARINELEYQIKHESTKNNTCSNNEDSTTKSTIFNKIKSMTIDEFAEWISKHSYSAWLEWFDKKYCKNCPDIICKYEDGLTEFSCLYCEINDKCKFFLEKESVPNGKEIIKMWLESESEDN